MPNLSTDDGVQLYYEATGSGAPVVFVHEFAGDYRSWEPQVRYFSRRYRCIAFNARGWPPSEVPQTRPLFTSARLRRHPLRPRRAQDRQGAHRRPVDGRVRDPPLRADLSRPRLLAAGRRCRYGSERSEREKFRTEATLIAGKLEKDGWPPSPRPMRTARPRAVENKDPRGFAEFKAMLAEHSAKGAANTQLGCSASARRSSTWRTGWLGSRCPCWLSPATRTGRACCPASSSSAPAVGRPAGRPQQRPCHQHRGAGGLQRGLADFSPRSITAAGPCATPAR